MESEIAGHPQSEEKSKVVANNTPVSHTYFLTFKGGVTIIADPFGA